MEHTLTSEDRILVVGDGNYSFTLALARKLANRENVVTSDVRPLRHSVTLQELHTLGVAVLHEFDVTSRAAYARVPFIPTVVVFNFPHTGYDQMRDINASIASNRRLLSDMFAAIPSAWTGARVLVTVKRGFPYDLWEVKASGVTSGWRCVDTTSFDVSYWQSRGYRHAATQTAFITMHVNINHAVTHEFKNPHHPALQTPTVPSTP
ncbi:hypothetical protein DIPPA_23080 [Diplonema papillatum]|nr:hypothetical protein DIPPA_23080 [Diplonema papillatum]